MKQLLLLCSFLLCAAASLPAQTVPLTLGKHTQPPVVVEIPDEQKVILFFYSDHNGKAEVCAVESDSTLAVRRITPNVVLDAPFGEVNNKLIGAFHQRGTSKYFLYLKIGKQQIWSVLLDRSDFSIKTAQVVDKPRNTLTMGGIQEGEKFYMLVRERGEKKGGILHVYETSDGATFTHHPIESQSALPLFTKGYDPIFPNPDVELDAETLAKNKDKIFTRPGHILFLTDTEFEANGTDNFRASVTTLDLSTYTLSHRFYPFFDGLQNERNRLSSFIFEGKLFQMGFKNDVFGIKVTDLADEKVLFSRILEENDSLNLLLNTTVSVPGRGIISTERSFETPDKFAKKLMRFIPYIQVRRSGDEYIIGMGGYVEVKNSGAPMAGPMGGFGAAGTGVYFSTGGYNYEQITFFYSVLKAGDFSHSDKFIQRTIQEQIKNLSDTDALWWTNLRAPGTFHFLGRFYFGEYSRSQDGYVFKRLKEITR